MSKNVPHDEEKTVVAYRVAGRKRAVDCPICGKMEHAPDISAENIGKVFEKYCETYIDKECQGGKSWCKYWIKT